MESKSQNTEFRNNPENFNSCTLKLLFTSGFFVVQEKKMHAFTIPFLS